MRILKKYLTIFTILSIVLSLLSTTVITLGQSEEKSIEDSFDETTPYTFKVEGIETAQDVEVSDLVIIIVAEIIEGQDGNPGDTITITLWDLTEDKQSDTITGQGALAVARLHKEVNAEHEYEIRIVTNPDGRDITGTYEYNWVETEIGGGGIPGFGTGSIVIGLLLVLLRIWNLQRD